MDSDLVNGLFELGGATLILLNIRALHRDKKIAGYSPWPLAFFTGWGLWNCWFYPVHGLWLSFVGGVALALANLVWLGHIAWYLKIRPMWILLGELERRNNADNV